jgi:hypothetical protein
MVLHDDGVAKIVIESRIDHFAISAGIGVPASTL